MHARSIAAALAIALASLACNRAAKKGEELIARGQLPEAERFLIQAAHERPADLELRLLLGRVYLLESRANEAFMVLNPLTQDPKIAGRVAAEYKAAADRAAQHTETLDAMSAYVPAAVRLDKSLRNWGCNLMIGKIESSQSMMDTVAYAAGAVDRECGVTAAKKLREIVAKTDPMVADADAFERMCRTIERVDPAQVLDCTHAMRDVAEKVASSDRHRALQILDAAARLKPEVATDLETVVLRSGLTDQPAVVGGAAQDILARYSGSSLEITKRMIREIAAALDLYASQHHRYPPVKGISQLASELSGYATSPIPQRDAWGAEFDYVSLLGSGGARIISGGADSHVDHESRLLGGQRRGAVDEYGADIIWEDGSIIQEPTEAALHKYDNVSSAAQH